MKINSVIVSLLFILTAFSCKDTVSNKELADAEVVLLNNYLVDAGIHDSTFQSTEIYYIERETGPGQFPVAGDVVSVRFQAYFLNDTIAASNLTSTQPTSFTLISDFSYNQYFPSDVLGFHYGISLMREGGKATFIVPSAQAYSNNAYNSMGVPKYTPFRFEVELTNISPSTRD